MRDATYATDLDLDAPSKRPARFTPKRVIGSAVAVLAFGAIVYGGAHYWTVARFLESTDNAYIKADSTIVSPKVSGEIVDVLVQDNQPVVAGQVLARIDARDFKTGRDQALADVNAATAAIANLDAQMLLQAALIAQAQADIATGKASLAFAQQDQARYQDLMKTGYGTVQRAQQTQAAFQERSAQLQRGFAGLDAAAKKIDVLKTERAQAEAGRERATALAQQAQLNLSYTEIIAPVDGTVGARNLRVGQYVQAGQQLFAVVPLQAVYAVANFKETQLTHVKDGQPVLIHVDSFPGTELRGHVDSVSPASGLEFALLPPDNATGNFTKIVQRIPVKIVLEASALSGQLRPGMSIEASINTKPADEIAR